jgi:hypothetical protein
VNGGSAPPLALESAPEALEDLRLLLLPPQASDDPDQTLAARSRWLAAAARTIRGYRQQPSVLRRTRNIRGSSVEVRRWTREAYVPLSPAGPQTLMLSPQGELVLRRLDGVRHLRRRVDETIDDEIYVFVPLPQPESAHLERVRLRALADLHPLGYQNWKELDWPRRQALAAFGGGWKDAAAALRTVCGDERTRSLELFLSEEAHPQLREAVMAAGLRGELRPGADVLAWLLAQPDWNLQPGLVAMARTAAHEDPQAAFRLHTHPNPQVRLRLADLLTGPVDRVGWLAAEKDDAVRDRILRAMESHHSLPELVEKLASETDPVRREALGWALVHWGRPISEAREWEALNKALFARLGPHNRRRLKQKLQSAGRLGLKARLLG